MGTLSIRVLARLALQGIRPPAAGADGPGGKRLGAGREKLKRGRMFAGWRGHEAGRRSARPSHVSVLKPCLASNPAKRNLLTLRRADSICTTKPRVGRPEAERYEVILLRVGRV